MFVNGYKIEPRANLRGANLREANLREADLRGANLREADLRGADLSWADLSWADLEQADLRGANLREANLRKANLRKAVNVPDLPHTIIAGEGDLIVYKKVSTGIAQLLIPKEAKRSNATGRKCRAEFAIVLDCPDNAVSLNDRNFYYHKGTTVRPIGTPFETNRWDECAPGIHFYLTREEAENH